MVKYAYIIQNLPFVPFLSVKLSGNKYLHTVQPSPSFISRIFSSSQTDNLYLLNTKFPILPPPNPGDHHFGFCLYGFDYSYKWRHTIFVLLWEILIEIVLCCGNQWRGWISCEKQVGQVSRLWRKHRSLEAEVAPGRWQVENRKARSGPQMWLICRML